MSRPRARFPFPAGHRADISVSTLAPGGAGLARLDGWPLFVADAVPGDAGTVEIDAPHPGHGTARWVDLSSPSPDRRTDPCSHAGECGGCSWAWLPLDQQPEWKARLFRETLVRVGHWPEAADRELPVDTFPMAYRLRSQFKVARDADGRVIVGFYGRGSRRAFDLAGCEVLSPASSEFVGQLRSALEGAGFLPEEVELVESPDGAERALYAHGEGIAAGLDDLLGRLAPLARGVEVEDRTGGGRRSAGEPFVTIPVRGVPHRVSARAFFQVNRHALDRFVERVEELLPERSNSAWDLYAGAGFFTFPLARRCRRVTAVEVEGASLADGRATAARLGARNVEFVPTTVERFLAPRGMRPPDVVLVDPPRAGMTRAVRERLRAIAPRRIVSVSCDAATFARDLAFFREGGWRVESLRLLDLFPGTWRVESVALFARD